MADRPAFQVPQPFRAGLQALALLNADHLEGLIRALRSGTGSLATASLADKVAEVVPEVDHAEAVQILEAVLSLVGARQRLWTDVPSKTLALDVAASPDLSLPHGDQERFADGLDRLLNLESLHLASKAQDLRTEHPHVFRGARLFTDIRPVFGTDATKPPAGAVVLGTLKIEFISEALQPGAFFVALDQSDLRVLKEVVDRGIEKTESLRNFLSSSDIAYWTYEDTVADEGSG